MELCPRDSMRMRLDYTENEIRNHRYHVVDGVLRRDMYIFLWTLTWKKHLIV